MKCFLKEKCDGSVTGVQRFPLGLQECAFFSRWNINNASDCEASNFKSVLIYQNATFKKELNFLLSNLE